MKSIIISFCIPVYNQCKLVKECIESIVPYTGNDIEIIVSDDCSSENIEELVLSYGDSRIKYFRNEQNFGHDLNIINSFKNASGKYAFLLRTRDHAYTNNIGRLIDFIKTHPNCSYITGKAIDENGKVRYSYDREIVSCGEEAINAHYNTYVHPSGSLYSLEKLDLNKLEAFLKSMVKNKQSFIGHSLMRLYLAEFGDFGYVKDITWIYINPSNNDIAVNHAPEKISVYDPTYTKERYYYVLKWAKDNSSKKYWKTIIQNEFKSYLNASTWKFYFENKDAQSQIHYSFERKKFSLWKERSSFINYSKKLITGLYGKEMYERLYAYFNKTIMFNDCFGWVKDFAIVKLRNTRVYDKFRSIYRNFKNQRY